MSIASKLQELDAVKDDIFDAIEAKGVTVPAGSGLADAPALIGSIPGGGGGGNIITVSLDIANFDTAKRTDGVFYFDYTGDASITKSGNALVFKYMSYFNIVGTDPSKLKSISITMSNNSYGNICYAGYRVKFVACAGIYFANYGVFQDFSDHVVSQDTHGMNVDWSGTSDGVGHKRYDHFSATKPITVKNVIDGPTNKFYANGNLVFECTYDMPQYKLPLLVSKGTVWRYDTFGCVGTDTTSTLSVTDITAELYT